MSALTQSALDFLRDLSDNNNKDWFASHKSRFEKDLKKPFEQWIGELIQAFYAIDPAIMIKPQDAIFRIYRDTRFSQDKRPYKEHVAAVISPYGRKQMEYPGFYVHLESGMLMLGGGAYFLEKPALEKVRRHIMAEPDKFRRLVQSPEFVEKYGELRGERNKILPVEFRDAEKEIPLIANKQFYYMAEIPAEKAIAPDSVQMVTTYFQAARQFNDFLVEALT
ncbi:MAG: DUF2461 domain-containing protein [Saprospiraceae bacterium]|nr:DUF2461 domain-containing protein [Saprospiraceae bacterium]